MYPERIVPGEISWKMFRHEHLQRYAYFAHHCRNKLVLDAACGTGYGSRLLRGLGAQEVVGVDVSDEAIDYARRYFAINNVNFARGNVECIPTRAESFDVVVSFETIEHLEDPTKFVKEVKRVLKTNGLFICSTPNKAATTGRNPHHLSELTFEEFSFIVSDYFDIHDVYHQSFSESFSRHIHTMNEIEKLRVIIENSKMMSLENRVRRLCRRKPLRAEPLSEQLTQWVEDDFVIEQINQPKDCHSVFILVCRPRANALLSSTH